MQRPEPAATGTLASKPLAHLLIYALDKRLTGTFELVDPQGNTAHVVVREGQVVRVTTSDKVTFLGHVLYELGHIDDATLSISLAEVAAAKRLHGQVLVGHGAITREQLAEGLRQQRARKIHHAFSFPPESSFAFFPSADFIGERPDDVEPADPLPFVWRGVRLHPSWNHVRATLARVAGRAIRLLESDIERLGLDEAERIAAECLRLKAATIPELAIIGGLTIQQTDLLAYFLVITKYVEVVDKSFAATSSAPPPSSQPPISQHPVRVATPSIPIGSGEYQRKMSFAMRAVSLEEGTIRIPSPVPNRHPSPMPGRPSSPVPPLASPPLPQGLASSFPPPPPGPSSPPPPATTSSIPPPGELGRKKSIVDRAKWIDQEDYFKVLMVARDATNEDVRAAFLRAAKVWHPDTLPASIAEVRPDCERVFQRITQAYDTLVDATKRRTYERSLDASLKDSAEADQLISQAEMHLALGDRRAAEDSVRRALVASPDRGEAAALLAFLAATSKSKGSPEHTDAQIKVLDMVIGKDPLTRRAHFYRAELHKRLEQHEQAVSDLRVAVTNDPDDVDAQRELKQYERKLREGSIQLRSLSPYPGAKRDKGLFDRILKK